MTRKRTSAQTAGVDAGAKRSRLANWDDRKDEILLAVLKEQQLLGNGVAGHFPCKAWTSIVEAFNNKTDLSYSRENLRNRLKVLKTTYCLYHAIVNKCGWQWDPVRNIPVNGSHSDWNKLIAVNPNFAKCKDRPFPRYKDIDVLCGKKTDEDSSKHSMAEADDLGVMNKYGHNVNSTTTSKNAEAPLDQYAEAPLNQFEAEADSTLLKPQFIPDPSCDPTPEGSEAFYEEQPSSSSSKQRITFAVPLSCQKRPAHQSDALAKLVDAEQQRLEIARNKFSRAIASRPNVYSIEDCMKKLEKVEGISPETFVVACEGFKEQDNRAIFMNLHGPKLAVWIERQMKLELQRFSNQILSSFPSNPPGLVPTSDPQQTPIFEKTAAGLRETSHAT